MRTLHLPSQFWRPVLSLLAHVLLTLCVCFAAKGAVTNPKNQLVFISHQPRHWSNDQMIQLAEPILRSPVVLSFYALSGAKVFEQTLTLHPPANAILLAELSDHLHLLPSGYYYYNLQTRGTQRSMDFADSLLFRDISNSHLPTDSTDASFSKFGDLNGDTFADLVLSRALALGQPRALINDGTGRFRDETADRLPIGQFFTNAIELLDADRDGDLDIFFIAEDTTSVITQSANRLYLNDGNGNFTDVSKTHLPTLPILSNNAAWGYVNEDSFPDLVVTGFARGDEPFTSSLFVLINDGTGRFVDQSAALLPDSLTYGVMDVALADVNGDERLDIALANMEMTITDEAGQPVLEFTGQDAVLLQNEQGEYVDATANLMPVDNEPTKLIRITDINNDAAPELYAINLSFLTNIHHQLYLNDGTGAFEIAAARLPDQGITFLNDVAFQDYDGNGFVDMYLVNVGPFKADPTAPDFLNLNTGGFMEDASNRLPQRSDFGVSTVTADIERDGDFDIFVSNGNGSTGPAEDMLLENLNVVVSVPGKPEMMPAHFSLSQNYPNPFNPTTTIVYALPKAAEITLKVYDLRGREVATLLAGRFPAGEHHYEWEANGLASGVYFYRLEADGFSATNKLVLIK